jgi:hypothetical protein
MDRREAGEVADAILTELRAVPYDELVARLLTDVETRVVVGESGTEYQAEIQAIWDAGQPGDLRVMVGVDDGSFRGAFRPEARDFVVAANGRFVGE